MPVGPRISHIDIPRSSPAPALPWRIRFRAMQRSARPHFRTRDHLCPHHQLILVREGVYEGRIGGEVLAVTAPALVATGPGERHMDACTGPLVLDAVQFSVVPGPTPDSSLPLMAPGRGRVLAVAGAHLASMSSAMDALAATADAPLEIRSRLQDALVAALVWRWLGLQPAADRHGDLAGILDRDVFAGRLLDLFERHARHALTVRQMADLLGMPIRTLDWHCRRAFATAPAQLFRRHRLRTARIHLLTGRSTVAQVADFFGFPSASHFARVYRAEFDRTPGEDLRQVLP